MGIVGDRPESGVRVRIERPREPGGPPWRYEGEAVTADARYAIVVVVDAGGSVEVEAASGAPASLEQSVRLIVRAAWKHARDEGAVPPRRITRWRALDPSRRSG